MAISLKNDLLRNRLLLQTSGPCDETWRCEQRRDINRLRVMVQSLPWAMSWNRAMDGAVSSCVVEL